MGLGLKIRIFIGILCLSSWAFSQIHLKKIDEVIPSERRLVLIRFFPLQFLTLDSSDINSNKIQEENWEKVNRPNQQFHPTKVTKGQFQNYLVFDQNQRKFWQFDSSFQLLTSLDIPLELQDGNLDNISFLFSPTNRLIVAQPDEGWIYQFTERMGKLFLVQKDPLSLNTKSCYSLELKNGFPVTCLSNKNLKIFDAHLNQNQILSLAGLNENKSNNKENKNTQKLDLKWSPKMGVQFLYELYDKIFCFVPQTGEFKDCTKNK